MSICGNFLSDIEINKNYIAAIVSGILFFLGWWILIGVAAATDHEISVGHIFIGIFGTLSFIMVNAVKNSHLEQDNSKFAKIRLLIGFVIGFAAVVAAIWVLIDDFINVKGKSSGPGIAILVQNVLILFGSMTYKFGRDEPDTVF